MMRILLVFLIVLPLVATPIQAQEPSEQELFEGGEPAVEEEFEEEGEEGEEGEVEEGNPKKRKL